LTDSLFPTLVPPTPDPPGRYVRVAVERGFAGKDGESSLTYGSDDEEISIGDRVRVPLGRGDTPTPGVVVDVGGEELLGGFDPAKVKRIIDKGRVALPEDLVELARWISGYYHAPLGLTLQTMTPAAVKHAVGAKTETVLAPPNPHPSASTDALKSLTPSARKAWQALSVLDPEPYPATARELADAINAPTVAAINRLERAGWLEPASRDFVRTRSDALGQLIADKPAKPHDLNEHQQAAIDHIEQHQDTFGAHLLFGVTGSGKTEVYMRLIEHTLARGKASIVLVPEIALTPQTAGRFVSRFGKDRVALLHSGLTQSQRHEQWADAHKGQRPIVVGARSAIFAPAPDIGLIIVDEEHDSSYKQEQTPRYHARDVAIVRARKAGCPVVLGSATPSLESWSNVNAGKASLLRLPLRATGASMPKVRLIDLADERRKLAETRSGYDRLVGPTLEAALRQTLEHDGQAIILLNRRGFASYIACTNRTCGWSMGCERCSVRMVMHKHRNLPLGGFVKCHHCHSEQRIPRQCPVCSSKVIKLGMGTQRAEDELRNLFPDGQLEGDALVRVDADAMRSASHYFEVLDRFGKGHARVLVGTQMIAKGLDFPYVKLVGVLNADTALALPDFRAGERTFQLIAQVAGRTGRAGTGSVIVQTMDPEAPPLVHASNHDYERFASTELADRDAAGLPPKSRMARIVLRNTNADRAEQEANALASTLRKHSHGHVRTEGPMPCVLERIDERYRFGIELFSTSAASIKNTITGAIKSGALKPGPDVIIDIDPQSLL